MKKICLIFTFVLASCVTISGTYKVYAVDSSGKPINQNLNIVAQGSRIYSVRNALCINNPGASIIIEDIKTGEELKGESGYQCHSQNK